MSSQGNVIMTWVFRNVSERSEHLIEKDLNAIDMDVIIGIGKTQPGTAKRGDKKEDADQVTFTMSVPAVFADRSWMARTDTLAKIDAALLGAMGEGSRIESRADKEDQIKTNTAYKYVLTGLDSATVDAIDADLAIVDMESIVSPNPTAAPKTPEEKRLAKTKESKRCFLKEVKLETAAEKKGYVNVVISFPGWVDNQSWKDSTDLWHRVGEELLKATGASSILERDVQK